MSDCDECGQPLLWGGMSWVEHTDRAHAAYRNILLTVLARRIQRYSGLRLWDIVNHDAVVIRWRNGVYRHQFDDFYVTVRPRETWEEMGPQGRAELLREWRIRLADMTEEKYGVTVNPATWLHRIYNGRVL